MPVSNTRLILATLTASVLPIAACSSRGQQAQDPVRTTDPSVQVEPQNPGASLEEIIPFSITCGSRDVQNANDPEVFRTEYFKITNDEGNNILFENSTVLPSEITFVPGSDERFVEAIEDTKEGIGPVEIPPVNGGAVLVYRSTNGGQSQQFGISLSVDGTLSARPNSEQNGGVAVQSVIEEARQLINMAYFPNANGRSIESFLNPGKDEWDNVPDAPVNPKSPGEHGFTRMPGGLGAYLNVPITLDSQPARAQRAGAQVFDPETSSACVALTGDPAGTMTI